MEIFWVSYQMPKFGTENEYDPTEYHFGVGTDGGEKDARAACEKHHKSCKIIAIEPYEGNATLSKQTKKGQKK